MKVFAAAAVLLLALAAPSAAREGDLLSQSSFLLGTQDWFLSGKGYSSQNLQRDRDRLVADDDASDPGKTWYFNAPKTFLGGDKSLAYNGWLSYELGHFEYQSMMKPTISTYDVILQCKTAKQNIGLMGVFRESSSTAHVYSVRFEEQFSAPNSTATWVTISTGKQVIQRDFVSCLQHLQGIQIRGSYFFGYEAVWLKDIKIIEGQIEKTGGKDFNNAVSADPSDASYILVNGVRQYQPRSEPASKGGQLQSRTCVSNDKYEILFDRPGCGINNNPLCVAADIAASRVPNIIQALDVTNGRDFVINQENVGRKGVPLTKPFKQNFFFNAAPRICSTATLTVIADGDLSDPSDNIVVYGEDGSYLGTLFAGNLSYDDANPWYQQNSEATPYVDSFAISQTKMMQYAADGQIRFLFASERKDDSPNVFSGTSKVNIDTTDCNSGSCDLKGKVIIRSIKITFSAAACYSAKFATDKVYNFDASILATQPVNISLSFATPTGAAATPGGDATISVVTSASIFELNSQLEVWSMWPNNTLRTKVASLFSSEQYRRKIKDQVSLGATTTLWAKATGLDTLPRLFADTVVIPREVLGDIVSNGAAKLTLYSTHPDNIASSSGKFSPIMFNFPLLSCFMHAIKKGPYMNVYIERDQSLHFDEPGFPLAGGDVTFFIAAHWSNHQRYTQTGNLDEMPGDRPDAFNPASLPTDITFLEKHRKWPHGYNYLQLRAGFDGEWLADLFLKDYTQYSTAGYYIDTVSIPRTKFNALVANKPNGVSKEFSFSLWVPPGSGVIILRSIVVGYPVATASDASMFDDGSSSPTNFFYSVEPQTGNY